MPSLVSNINSKHVTSLTPIYLIKTGDFTDCKHSSDELVKNANVCSVTLMETHSS